jgi:hypothetical protein
MLRTNLATRPFYDVRAVQLALGALAALVVVVSVFNTAQIIRLTAAYRTVGARAIEADEEAARLRAEAARIRSRIDAKELERMAAATREANAVIDQRVFSWTALLAQLETTLPVDVRLSAIAPRLDNGRFIVGLRVQARQVEDVETFIEALESTGAFRDVLEMEEQPLDNGLIAAIIEGTYVPPSREPSRGGEP